MKKIVSKKLNVTLCSDTPVVGCEIVPMVFVNSVKASTDDVKHTWYRLNNDVAICSIHSTKVEKFQCLSCVTRRVPVKESFFCSKDCIDDARKEHKARHIKASMTLGKTNRCQRPGEELRSCGSSNDENYVLFSLTTNTVDQDCTAWKLVSTARAYVPKPQDFACVLRLESVIEDTEGNVLSTKEVLTTDRVLLPSTPDRRDMISFASQHASCAFNVNDIQSLNSTLTVLSYNILSDVNVNTKLHGYCPKWALAWEYRRENLLREIVGYHADIICLQEVQSNHFKEFFEPQFRNLGYSVVYKKKCKSYVSSVKYASNGCATFFRKDKFQLVHYYKLDYSELAWKTAAVLQPNKQKEALIRLLKDDVATVVILEQKINGKIHEDLDCRFCVVNTQIHSNANMEDIKLWQVVNLLHGLDKVVDAQVPVLVCGDLSSLPSSAPHSLVVKGEVDAVHKGMKVDPLGIYPHLKLAHKLHLVSAYSSFGKQQDMLHSTLEPLFTKITGTFFGTTDYIFYTADWFEVIGLLELMDVESARKYIALPSRVVF